METCVYCEKPIENGVACDECCFHIGNSQRPCAEYLTEQIVSLRSDRDTLREQLTFLQHEKNELERSHQELRGKFVHLKAQIAKIAMRFDSLLEEKNLRKDGLYVLVNEMRREI